MWIKTLLKFIIQKIINFLTFPFFLIYFSKKIKDIEKQLEDVQDLTLDTIEIVPPKGWSNTIQNAIMNLDNRLETLSLVLQQHQKNFNVLANEREKLEKIATQPKDQLN